MANMNEMRLDADEQVFFDNQLALVKSRTYDVQHKALKALSLLPVSTEQDPGATHIIWRSYDKVGMAKIIADYANDFPRADIAGVEHSSPVKDLGVSYGYSVKEIRRAQKAGVALDAKRAEAARRAIDEKQDSIAWKGDAQTAPVVARLGAERPQTKSLPTSLALSPLPRKARTASNSRIRSSCRSRST